MATYPSVPTTGVAKVYGGTPYARLSDPAVTGKANALGTYALTAFRATLGDISNALFVPETAGALDTSAVGILVFTADVPVISKLACIDTTNFLQYDAPVYNITSLPFLVTTSGGATAVVSDGIGAVSSGYAGDNSAVAVTGFTTVAAPQGPNGETTTLYVLDCIANGATIAGVVSNNYLLTSTAQAPQPIILFQDSYTAAIRDAGNLWVDGAGLLFQVVGLYEVLPPT
jgi:hypothetical protein